ncbi:TIGR03854 family LLM class F420-dependent oxidoreductase [Amycolatopsis sp. H20-H5]|uniref:TIGR03854 family LLM class F420-dependent oxidoreductase n=1 Tax=Amycolatopsis sp. H20-H5 TaxID=3046309 RepID=UPI002DB87006|nr:TIGR03854 family LLM class F420-dependent oxidoreductase [Amycolatopsis sp. H20-H5]MEC3976072.1 TIGR03854 family LLM class F420-dependent oxidoreductase [Amycolatopsis sp. H20-H5]
MADELKIRIGVGIDGGTGAGEFGARVDLLEKFGVDSLWLPEAVYSERIDPLIGMTHALARTSKLKVGTGVSVLPGRNPVLVAKQLSSLAGLAPKRVLPVFGLQPARKAELDLFPVPQGQRGAVFDESLMVIRALLEQDVVSFDGEYFQLDGVSLSARPANRLDLWLGGSAPAGLRRIGRLADGWLGSFLTPPDARAARESIQAAAAEAGREIEADHFGMSIALAPGGIPPELAASVARRKPGNDPAALVAGSWADARRLVEQYVEAGLTKFVISPVGHQDSYESFLETFMTELVPLQN